MLLDLIQRRPVTGRNLDPAVVDAFAASLDGIVILPGSDDYETARRVWNAAIDRQPALIVCPAGVADVQAAVRFAATHELPLAVRGGGHGFTGAAIAEAGLTIDLSALK